jgi:hypothetical protein
VDYGFQIRAHPTTLTSGDPCCRESPKCAYMSPRVTSFGEEGEQLGRPCAGLKALLEPRLRVRSHGSKCQTGCLGDKKPINGQCVGEREGGFGPQPKRMHAWIKHSRKKELASFGEDRLSWAKDFFIGIFLLLQNRKDQDRKMTPTGAP